MGLPSRDLVSQLRAAFAEPTVEVEELADADPRKHVLRRMGDKFTAAVHFLRSEFPNESIRRLMATVWDLVGHRIVPLSHGPPLGVMSLSFCAYVRGGRQHAILMVPDNWLEQMKKDPVYETGAIVFVGSRQPGGRLLQRPRERRSCGGPQPGLRGRAPTHGEETLPQLQAQRLPGECAGAVSQGNRDAVARFRVLRAQAVRCDVVGRLPTDRSAAYYRQAVDRQQLVDQTGDEELLFADGFDDAILGVIERCSQPLVVVYDRNKCIEILVDQGLSGEEAEEHFAFNVSGAWVGDRTPAFLSLPGKGEPTA